MSKVQECQFNIKVQTHIIVIFAFSLLFAYYAKQGDKTLL